MFRQMTLEQVVRSVSRGSRAQRVHNRSAAVRRREDVPFHFGIIACALRFFTGDVPVLRAIVSGHVLTRRRNRVFAAASMELARAAVCLVRDRVAIVGFRPVGAEAGFPADDHRDAFQYATRISLKKTSTRRGLRPRSISQAITDCYANESGTHMLFANT